MPELDREFKWGLEVWLQNDKRVAFRASDRRTLMKLNQAIATLALKRGAQYRPASLGFDAAYNGHAAIVKMLPGNGADADYAIAKLSFMSTGEKNANAVALVKSYLTAGGTMPSVANNDRCFRR